MLRNFFRRGTKAAAAAAAAPVPVPPSPGIATHLASLARFVPAPLKSARVAAAAAATRIAGGTRQAVAAAVALPAASAEALAKPAREAARQTRRLIVLGVAAVCAVAFFYGLGTAAPHVLLRYLARNAVKVVEEETFLPADEATAARGGPRAAPAGLQTAPPKRLTHERGDEEG